MFHCCHPPFFLFFRSRVLLCSTGRTVPFPAGINRTSSCCFFPLCCVFFLQVLLIFLLFHWVFSFFSFFGFFVFSFFLMFSFFFFSLFLSSVFLWFSLHSSSVCLHAALGQAQRSRSPACLAGGEASSSPQASPPHSPPGPPLDSCPRPPPGSPSPPPPPKSLPPSVAPLSRSHFFYSGSFASFEVRVPFLSVPSFLFLWLFFFT